MIWSTVGGKDWHAHPFFRVDQSPQTGTASPGDYAAPLRHQVMSTVSDYREIEWGPITTQAGNGWQWQFTGLGLEQQDTFFNACGNSYALLASAPIRQFQHYHTTFGDVLRSFAPAC